MHQIKRRKDGKLGGRFIGKGKGISLRVFKARSFYKIYHTRRGHLNVKKKGHVVYLMFYFFG